MRRFSYKKYLFLGTFLFLAVSLPPLFVDSIRGRCVAFFSPLLRGVGALRVKTDERLKRLEGENHLLRVEIGKLRALLEQEHVPISKYEETSYLLDVDESVLPARVIYRDPGNWTGSLWVNVGEVTNQLLGKHVVGKNSPVLVGNAVVGVVDYVGRKQSRIRLLTDAGLKPSVRVLRGSRDYLAKGILEGSSWKGVLRGIGFNYDFPDEQGPEHDLSREILKEGDLLVTTGMDGVFPIGLRVAQVSKVFPLREGAYTYEIEAVPVASNLESLHTVFIIPPIGYEEINEDR